jgi:drug/metabolite transporter (DMT)-like permease
MWFIYAIAAALVWGIGYAACGRVLQRGFSSVGLFFLDMLFGLLAMCVYLTATGKWGLTFGQGRQLGADAGWLAVTVVATTSASLLSFLAIENKNATLASLIEISYPFFVALFAWLLFRDVQLSWPTAIGGALILSGVALIYRFN